jgi:hypothetical protein
VPPVLLTQLAVAAVWLYEGLWCKLLGRMPHQFDVVGAVPFFNPRSAAWVLRGLGLAECGLAAWVLSGWQPVGAAVAQTGLLVAMNSGGLFWARQIIPDPAGMVVKNFAFLVLAWVAAGQASLLQASG